MGGEYELKRRGKVDSRDFCLSSWKTRMAIIWDVGERVGLEQRLEVLFWVYWAWMSFRCETGRAIK